jgi:hypothetical protein
MVRWHPRIRRRDLRTWLHEYYVLVHFLHAEALFDVGHLVHSLYNSFLDEYSDRQSMLPALRQDETIAFCTAKNRGNQRHNIRGTIQLCSSIAPVNVNKLFKFGNVIVLLPLSYEVIRMSRAGRATIHMHQSK